MFPFFPTSSPTFTVCVLNHYNRNEVESFKNFFQDGIFFPLYFISFFLHLFTCVCIVWVTSPLHPHLPSWQNMFYPLVLWFCWNEYIRHNKKDIAFLLLFNKDSYTETFLALLPCTCILQPTLVHLCQNSLLLSPSHSGLCQFKITIFASLQWAHQPHSSFRFPSLSLFLPCMFSSYYVTHVQ
jgi:hypothetical protein